ncbi:expressed unknown protein [Seminavis robusta]|uniref:Uncharacterized protein n=1 Tax=Seminavis robusta TaxID=568900 RepID=A0A9N8DFP6_9STRA|nr:expressed unknown protein [Seminavis robusta]|eukprot:Sro102_g052210.1 n/a (338) ;mRNA; f:104809-105822
MRTKQQQYGYSRWCLRHASWKFRDWKVWLILVPFLLCYRLYLAVLTSKAEIAIPAAPLMVVAPAFYDDTNPNNQDVRYALGLESCRQAAKHGVRLLIIDASPDHDTVSQSLTKAGTDRHGKSWVHVMKQTSRGKKGAALKEAIAMARQQLKRQFPRALEQDTYIAIQEPEKFDVFRFWNEMTSHMTTISTDILVPHRKDESFHSTYPIEQYHSEQFANLYLDTLGQKVGFPSIDWTFGPIAFRTSLAPHWLSYDEGDTWDVQIVPMIRAWKELEKKKTGSVGSYTIDYHHPAKQKQQEEGVSKWGEKRLFQLGVLFEKVGGELKKQGKVPVLYRMTD